MGICRENVLRKEGLGEVEEDEVMEKEGEELMIVLIKEVLLQDKLDGVVILLRVVLVGDLLKVLGNSQLVPVVIGQTSRLIRLGQRNKKGNKVVLGLVEKVDLVLVGDRLVVRAGVLLIKNRIVDGGNSRLNRKVMDSSRVLLGGYLVVLEVGEILQA